MSTHLQATRVRRLSNGLPVEPYSSFDKGTEDLSRFTNMKVMSDKTMIASRKPKMRVQDGESPWKFANISTPQNSKDVTFRKMVRAQAARRYRNRSSTSQDGERKRSLAGSTCIDTTKLSAPSSSATLDHGEEGSQVTQVQPETVDWPNQMNQLLMEAQRLCDGLAPLTDIGNMGDSGPNRGEDTPDHIHSPPTKHMTLQPVPVTSPATLLASGNLDPFNSFPIEYRPKDFELLYHCKRSIELNKRTSILLLACPA